MKFIKDNFAVRSLLKFCCLVIVAPGVAMCSLAVPGLLKDFPDEDDKGKLGWSCKMDSDCRYQGGKCIRSSKGWAEGYCSMRCGEETEADLCVGNGGVCLDPSHVWKIRGDYCFKQCMDDGDCRANYRCRSPCEAFAVDGGCGDEKLCVPSSVGAQCLQDEDCGWEGSNLGEVKCYHGTIGIGGQEFSFDGYCTATDCSSSEDCGPDADCIMGGTQLRPGVCLRKCDIDEDCRIGYVCRDVASGGRNGYCLP